MIGLLKIRQVKDIEVEGLGQRIHQARVKFCKESGKSLEDICAQVPVDRSHWYNIENETMGKNGALHFKMLLGIQRVLEVDFGISEEDFEQLRTEE